MKKTNLSKLLLNWYQNNGRKLPWRATKGAHPNPYVVMVSEFMLQQTTVKTVIKYFEPFIHRFPTIQDLAAADLEEVYQLWQGLGYYTRARSLHHTAQTIVNEFGGQFPQELPQILKLKGFGSYTAASFSALAFNLPATVIDGNVIRVICRLFHLTEPVERIKEDIITKASQLTDCKQAADYASAIMDLGATICTPKTPQCLFCPWKEACQSRDKPDLEQIPNRTKIDKKEKNGSDCLIFNHKGQVFIRNRIEKGLLSGLYEFPWKEDGKIDFSEIQDSGKQVCHIFTHIRLTLKIYTLKCERSPLADGLFVYPKELKNYPLSTLMKKVCRKMGFNI